jgi:hypothetical protein
MSQLFSRSHATIFRVVFWGLPVAAIGLFGVGAMWRSSNYQTEVNFTMEQPVAFSHKHHAGDLGIDCRYCHTTVEKSAFAGMPTAHTCMSCHSQIWTDSPLLEPVRLAERNGTPLEWWKVYRLPQYVYFNHSIHIHNDVQCSSCHGEVDQMPLMTKHRTFLMEDCLACHRHPEKYVPASVGQTFDVEKLMSCNTCHR